MWVLQTVIKIKFVKYDILKMVENITYLKNILINHTLQILY